MSLGLLLVIAGIIVAIFVHQLFGLLLLGVGIVLMVTGRG